MADVVIVSAVVDSAGVVVVSSSVDVVISVEDTYRKQTNINRRPSSLNWYHYS